MNNRNEFEAVQSFHVQEDLPWRLVQDSLNQIVLRLGELYVGLRKDNGFWDDVSWLLFVKRDKKEIAIIVEDACIAKYDSILKNKDINLLISILSEMFSKGFTAAQDMFCFLMEGLHAYQDNRNIHTTNELMMGYDTRLPTLELTASMFIESLHSKNHSYLIRSSQNKTIHRPKINFKRLPSEIILHIFSYLCPEMILSLTAVNHAFRVLATDNLFWKIKFERHFPQAFKTLSLEENPQWMYKFRNENTKYGIFNYTSATSSYPAYPTNRKSMLKVKQIFFLINESDSETLNNRFSNVSLDTFDIRAWRRDTTLLKQAQEIGHRGVLNFIYKIAKARHSINNGMALDTKKCDRHGRTILYWAIACHQSPDTIKMLLSQGSQVDEEYFRDKMHPIHIAAQAGYLEIVNTLIANHSQLLEQTDKNGETPLIYASKEGHENVIAYFIENKANIHAMTKIIWVIDNNDANKTSLYWATQQGHIHVVDRLLKAGAIATTVAGIMEEQPIHIAVKSGCLALVKVLIDHDSLLLEQKDKYGQTALLWSAAKGYTEIVTYLISKGANVNVATRRDSPMDENHGETALHWAAKRGFASTVHLLLKAGASTTALDNLNKSPLHVAVREGKLDVVKVFIEYNAELLEQPDLYNQTPLFLAVIVGHIDIVRYLIGKQANVNVVFNFLDNHPKNGYTPLHSAASRHDRGNILKLLIKANADINALDEAGHTALDVAIDDYTKHTLQLLIYSKRLKCDPTFSLRLFDKKEKMIPQEKIAMALKALKKVALDKAPHKSLDEHKTLLENSELQPIYRFYMR